MRYTHNKLTCLDNQCTIQRAGISKETVTRMLREAQIDGERRGETLDLQEFAAVAEAWTKTLQEGAAFSEKEK